MKKRLLSLALVFLLLISSMPTMSVLAASDPSFVVSTVEGERGDTVEVTVSTKNNPGIVSLKVNIGYDASALELVSIDGGAFVGTSFGPLTNNPIAVSWVNALETNNTTDGVVATLTFKIKDDAPYGASAVTVTHDPEDVYDYGINNVAFTDVNGSVNVLGGCDHEYDNEIDADCNNCGAVRETTSFVVDAVEGNRGETVEVTVSTKNNPGIVSFKVDIGYDAKALELVSITGGAFASTAFGPLTNNPIAVGWLNTIEPNNTTNGVMATLTFKIKDDAPYGASAITVTHDAENVFDYDFNNVAFANVNGSVTVVSADCEHEYDNACDADCNLCGETRVLTGHTYASNYDTKCDACGATRTIASKKGTEGVFTYTIVPDENGGVATITKCSTAVSGMVEIPGTIDGAVVKVIGNTAFKGCKLMTSVVIPEGVTTLDKWSFYSCTGLTTVTLPLTLTTIANDAFSNCRVLAEVRYDGEGKESIAIGTGNTYLVDAVWYGTHFCDHIFTGKYDTKCSECGVTRKISTVYGTYDVLSYIITPDENGGEVAISKCSTKVSGMVEIPSTIDGVQVTTIKKTAFKSCKGLTNVIVPEGVTTIEKWAFYSCSVLTGITLPTTLTTVVEGAFVNCRKLVDVWYYGESKDNIAIATTGNEKLLNATWYSNDTCEHAYSGEYDSVCDVCDQKRNIAPKNGTYGSLSYTIKPDRDGGGVVITLCDTAATGVLEIPDTIEGITVKVIANSAFARCTSLTGIVIPEGVTTLEKWAFYYCSALTDVTLPASLTTVGEGAFQVCNKLANVWYNGYSMNDITFLANNACLLDATWQGDKLCLHAYTNGYDTTCNLCGEVRKIASVTGTYGPLTYTIVPDGDGGAVTIKACNTTTTGSVVIPNIIEGITVKTVGTTAFKGCKQVTSVVVPEGVTTLEKWAFYYCSALTQVTLPDSLTDVIEGAFVGCNKLATVWYNGDNKDGITVGTNNTKLNSATWNVGNTCANGHTYDSVCDGDCNACGDVREAPHEYVGIYDTHCGGCGEERVIEATTGTYGPFTYTVIPDENGGAITITKCDTTSTGEVVIPGTIEGATVKVIAQTAFKGCKQVTSVVIGEGVTTIEKWAFYYCSALTQVTLPASLTDVAESAFVGCNKLATVYYSGTSKDDITIGTGNTKLESATWYIGG